MLLAPLLLAVAHARVLLDEELGSVEQVQPKDALPLLLPMLARPAQGFQVRSDHSLALARDSTLGLGLRGGGAEGWKPSGFDKVDPLIPRPYDREDAYALSTVLEPKGGLGDLEATLTPVPTPGSLNLIEKAISKPVPKLMLKGTKMMCKFLKKWAPRLVGAIAACRLVIMPIQLTPSLSMYPTFDQNDVVAVDKVSKFIFPFKRREVVVFNPPPNFWAELPEEDPHHGKKVRMIKRVVAVAGDTVEMKDGLLYINDEPQEENFILGAAEYDMPKQKVPAKSVFVLGDNRNESFDSHIWGFLPTDHIIGRATMHYRPLIRVGPLDGQETWDNAKGALEAEAEAEAAEAEEEADAPATAETLVS